MLIGEIFNRDRNRYEWDSIDQDETANNELFHQDLYCVPFCFIVLTEMPICNNGFVQIKSWICALMKLWKVNEGGHLV